MGMVREWSRYTAAIDKEASVTHVIMKRGMPGRCCGLDRVLSFVYVPNMIKELQHFGLIPS